MASLFSLKFRIAGTIFVLEAIMMAFVLGQVFGELKELTQRQLAAQEEVTLDLMAGLGRLALLTGEYAEFQPQIESLKRDPRVVQALLADAKARVVAASDGALLGKQTDRVLSSKGAWRSHDLVSATGKLGTIAIEFSNLPLIEAERRAQTLAISIAIMGMGLIAVFGVAIGWALTRRLAILSAAAKRMAKGNLSVQTGLRGRDEIGELGQSFDGMAARLAADQAQLVRLNTELELRVADRTAQLSAANAQLQEALATLRRAQDEMVHAEKLASLGAMVAGVAHELNTPIGNSVLVASTLKEKAVEIQARTADGTMRKSELIEFSRNMEYSGDLLMRNLARAASLIQSFKQVAVDQESEQRRHFDLRQTLGEIVTTLSPMLRRSPHVLELEVEADIEMDSFPGPLAQIVTNLVSNALAHGFDEGKPGHMRLTARRQGKDRVSLVFADDGRGIAREHIGRIFDPFFTTRMGQGGSGLGLHILYNITTRLLGGTVTVDSAPGKGTRFLFELPCTAPAG